MLRELGPDERDALYHGLVSSVRALHAGLPRQLDYQVA